MAMEYCIEISATAKKELSGLPHNIAKRISSKISELRNSPFIGKPVGRSVKLGTMVYELRFFSPNIRVYYTVTRGLITIEEVEYAGKVNVYKIGDKRSQRRDVDGLL